jgi:lysozyme family protein
MADFLHAYKKTAINEGGYANDPADKGGETWKGIARNANPSWKGWIIVDQMRNQPWFPKSLYNIPELETLEQELYKRKYWDAFRGDEVISQQEADSIYDMAVNAGVKTAIKLAQKSLGIAGTGRMDNFTLQKLNNKI